MPTAVFHRIQTDHNGICILYPVTETAGLQIKFFIVSILGTKKHFLSLNVFLVLNLSENISELFRIIRMYYFFLYPYFGKFLSLFSSPEMAFLSV